MKITVEFKKEPPFFDSEDFVARIEMLLFTYGFTKLDTTVKVEKGDE